MTHSHTLPSLRLLHMGVIIHTLVQPGQHINVTGMKVDQLKIHYHERVQKQHLRCM